MHKLRKPRIVIYNASEEITTENVVAIIKAQNSEILTNGENMEAKFRYKGKIDTNSSTGRPSITKTNPTNQTKNWVGNM